MKGKKMGRPKGSRNKAVENKVEPLKEGKPPIGKLEAATKSDWMAKPDMGKIQPPPLGQVPCLRCSHEKSKHYGGANEWCNTHGCPCQAWNI